LPTRDDSHQGRKAETAGVPVPAGTPKPIVDRWQRKSRARRSSEVKESCWRSGRQPSGHVAPRFAAYINADLAREDIRTRISAIGG